MTVIAGEVALAGEPTPLSSTARNSNWPMWLARHTTVQVPPAPTVAWAVAAQPHSVWWPRRSISTMSPARAPETVPVNVTLPCRKPDAREDRLIPSAVPVTVLLPELTVALGTDRAVAFVFAGALAPAPTPAPPVPWAGLASAEGDTASTSVKALRAATT